MPLLLESAAYQYLAPLTARVAGDLWRLLLEQGMRAEVPDGLELGLGELVASTVLVFEVAGVRWIRDACNATVEADLAKTRAVKEHRELADRRNATSAALYDLLVEFRERCRAANPGDEKLRLGVSGRSPRAPGLLRRTTGIVLTAVWRWGCQPPVDLTGLVPGLYVRRLERLAGDLDSAVGSAAQAAARALVHFGALQEKSPMASRLAAEAKVYASEAANRACYEAVQIHGGNGFSEDYEIARLYRDVRVTTIYEGTSEMQRLVIARDLLGT